MKVIFLNNKGRKKIFIDHDVYLGANVTILDGVTIGNGSVIGAGAVVSKDIPDYAIAVGVAIKIIKYYFTRDVQYELNRIAWGHLSEEELKNVNRYFFDVIGYIYNFNKSN